MFVLFVFSISFGVKILGFGGNLYMYWKFNSLNLLNSFNLIDVFLLEILILNDYIFGEEF